MFLIPSGTKMRVYVPYIDKDCGTRLGGAAIKGFDCFPWRTHVSDKERVYDSHEVWDAIAVHNKRADVPPWVARVIQRDNCVILHGRTRKGRVCYASVPADKVRYVD